MHPIIIGQSMLVQPAAGNVTTMTWNPSDKHASVTLSNGNLTAVASSSGQAVRATVGKSSGKWYFEVTVNSAKTFGTVGVATASASLSTWVGGDAYGYGIATSFAYNNGSSNALTQFAVTDGDVIGVAVDLDNGEVWFRENGAGSWAGTSSGNGDPVTRAYPRFSGLSGTFYPACAPAGSGGQHTINATLLYTPPTGFSIWT